VHHGARTTRDAYDSSAMCYRGNLGSPGLKKGNGAEGRRRFEGWGRWVNPFIGRRPTHL